MDGEPVPLMLACADAHASHPGWRAARSARARSTSIVPQRPCVRHPQTRRNGSSDICLLPSPRVSCAWQTGGGHQERKEGMRRIAAGDLPHLHHGLL